MLEKFEKFGLKSLAVYAGGACQATCSSQNQDDWVDKASMKDGKLPDSDWGYGHCPATPGMG
jgi:hypothetical protein